MSEAMRDLSLEVRLAALEAVVWLARDHTIPEATIASLSFDMAHGPHGRRLASELPVRFRWLPSVQCPETATPAALLKALQDSAQRVQMVMSYQRLRRIRDAYKRAADDVRKLLPEIEGVVDKQGVLAAELLLDADVGSAGDKSVAMGVLTDAFMGDDFDVRRRAINAICFAARKHDFFEDTGSKLAEALQDKDAEVRALSAQALGIFGGRLATPQQTKDALARLADADETDDVREAAASALEAINARAEAPDDDSANGKSRGSKPLTALIVDQISEVRAIQDLFGGH